jgi:uncharacterized protein YgiM (DUF1202 family)
MQQAQQLIKQGRYDEARRILRRIDTPTAREWLAKLDQRAPQAPRRRSDGGRVIRGILSYVLTIILSAVLTAAVLAAMVFASSSTPSSGPSIEATEVVQIVTPSATPDLRTGIVISNQNINVRSGPGTNNDSIASLIPGTTVEIIDESDDGQWFNVRLADGNTGWVSADLLDAEQAPTSIAGAITTAPEVTPPPGDTCPPEVAQAWYDANRAIVNEINFVLLQAKANPENVDYDALSDQVLELRAAFEAADAPACVSEVRGVLLFGYQAVHNGLQNVVRGFPNEAVSELTLASQQFQRANELLDELGIVTTYSNCGEAEVWYTGIEDDVRQFLSTIENISVDTRPSAEIRQAIFDLQELRNRLNVAFPDCATAANNHLQASVVAAVRLFQSIMAEEAVSTKQQHLAVMVTEATEFLNAMRELGIRIA